MGEEFINTGTPYACRIDNVKEAARNNVVQSGLEVTEDSGGASMIVDFASGVVFIGGTRTTVSSGSKTVTTADGSNARKDIISVNSSGTVNYAAGTPAATPLPPALPVDEVLLAILNVPANDTTISNAQIDDTRIIVSNPINILPFGGDGNDGALTITSGTTNIAPDTWFEYSSIDIQSAGTLGATTGSANLFVKSVGGCIIAGTIDLVAKGGGGGAGGGAGSDGSDGGNGPMIGQGFGEKGFNFGNAGGTGGTASSSLYKTNFVRNGAGATRQAQMKLYNFGFGAGGGGGGGGGNSEGGSGGGGGGAMNNAGVNGGPENDVSVVADAGGAGGAGAGAIYMEIGGSLNFTGTIDVSGVNGTQSAGIGGGGGGGGAGGVAYITVEGSITDSGTKTAGAGTGGSGNGNGGNGGNGGAGTITIAAKPTPALS